MNNMDPRCGRRAVIPVPYVKVTLPLRPEQLPRDVLPREGAPAVPIELVIEVAAEGGKRPLTMRAEVNSRNYRRAVKAIDEFSGNATVLIQGRLTGNYELLDAGLSVQPKVPAAPSTTAPTTSASPGPPPSAAPPSAASTAPALSPPPGAAPRSPTAANPVADGPAVGVVDPGSKGRTR